jgi:hypothetical protein
MQRCFSENAHTDDMFNNNSTSRRSLKVSLVLLERLTERSNILYSIHTNKRHEEKWGKARLIFGEEDKFGMSTVTATRENVTSLNKEEYESDFLENQKINDKIYKRDLDLFFKILHKYHEYWWD